MALYIFRSTRSGTYNSSTGSLCILNCARHVSSSTNFGGSLYQYLRAVHMARRGMFVGADVPLSQVSQPLLEFMTRIHRLRAR
eukprot:1782807-Rhodomonas_salina.2